MPIYASSRATPPAMDPADLGDVHPVVFDFSDVIAKSGVTFRVDPNAQRWTVPTGVELGDGVKTVDRNGIALTPDAPEFVKLDPADELYKPEPAATATAVRADVWYTAPGTYLITLTAVFDGSPASLTRSVEIVVEAEK